MPPPPSHVFISYHRADVDKAERVRAHLRAHGVRTWMDRYDIPLGAYWPDEIDQGLRGATVVLGILSPDAVDARNVKNEWDWALQNGKRLVLLKTHDCVVPHRYVSVNFVEADADRFAAALEELTCLPELTPVPGEPALPTTRYARAGELSIAYQQFGTGPVDLVWVPGFVSHCEHTWRLPAFATHLRRFGELARIIMFDKRGTGMSDRVPGVAPLEERMDDIRAVMDACGVERAAVFGISEGVPLATLFAAAYPQRTTSLILFGGYATKVRKDDHPWCPPYEEQLAALEQEGRTLHEVWGTDQQARTFWEARGPSVADDPVAVRWAAELLRLGSSPGAYVALRRMNLLLDVRDVLPTVRVPTLVLHRIDERATPLAGARYMADQIPGARLVELPGDDHTPFFGDQETVFAELAPFLSAPSDQAAPDTGMDTILATVAVVRAPGAESSTLRRAAERIAPALRAEVAREDGAGDVVARFDGPARAVRFAAAVTRALAAMGIDAGVGVHIGEVTVGSTTIAGEPVEHARRLAAQAAPGQVVASGIVRDLAPGSGIDFTPVTVPGGVPGAYEAQVEADAAR